MLPMDDKLKNQTDKDIIDELGGPTKVADLLGYDKAKGGVQRVQNWTTRGIPPRVKLAYPELFLRDFAMPKRRSADEASIPL